MILATTKSLPKDYLAAEEVAEAANAADM